MSRRCYSPEARPDARVTLDGGEAHHLLHVLRAAVGDEVELFDGRGNAFQAVVTERGRRAVELQTGSALQASNPLARRVTLAVALPKGDRQRWLVEKCTELGVERLIPIVTERSVAQPKDAAGKLGRYVVEACKQSGRNHLMEIAAPRPWAEWILDKEAGLRLIAHPGADQASSVLSASEEAVQIAIGPEGGFTEEEVSAAKQQGWRPWSLGVNILRIETAAIACAALALLSEAESTASEGTHSPESAGRSTRPKR